MKKTHALLETSLERLKKEHEKIEFVVEERDDTYNERSEKWQESEKGVEFQNLTDQYSDKELAISEFISDLEYLIERIEAYINE